MTTTYIYDVDRSLESSLQSAKGGEIGHGVTMKLIESASLKKESPRQDAQILWRKHSSPLCTQLIVRSSENLDPSRVPGLNLVRADDSCALDNIMKINILLEATYTPFAPFPPELKHLEGKVRSRGKRQAIPEDKMEEKAQAKLSHLCDDLHITSITPVRIKVKNGKSVPGMEIDAQLRGINKEAYLQAYKQGVGRAKNFGAGMIINKSTFDEKRYQ